MNIGIIGSGWLAQAMARAWRAKGQITLTTRDSEKQQQLIDQGFNCVIYELGDELPFLASIDTLIIATTSKQLNAHQSLIKHLEQFPDLKILFTSSTSVYPNDSKTHAEDSKQVITDHPLYLIEQCLQQHPETTVIRCGGLIGPGRHPGRFFRDKPIPSPHAPVNLLPLVDAVGVYWFIIEQNIGNMTINACHHEHPTKGEYYPKMAKSIGLKPPTISQHNSNPGKTVNSRLLTEALGYAMQGSIWEIDVQSNIWVKPR
ncbi:Rossmann-fold NAD(P)-binding domain-containing protein [Marinicella gelatinilytica]|uniref:hypothetical protein n=1 Tax=Marinicella gelatinilytica TaxID=2996017 RepID=UPI002260F088|nr:hypothetical protein [Marinicella gelatinilytica]MCX7545549.1 hypothetical protein [Marinicella gelatinilytica]